MQKKPRNSTPCYKVNPEHPDLHVIQDAAGTIHRGGVVVFPTRNLYGLAVDAFNGKAVDRIFSIKKRPEQKPILVLIRGRQDLNRLIRRVPPEAVKLMDRFWPGKLTIIMESINTLPRALTAGTGRIGVRLPAHPVAAALVEAVGGPITGTSANISGKPGCSRIFELDSEITGSVDMILDAGDLEEGIGSTVINMVDDGYRILREGGISRSAIEAALG